MKIEWSDASFSGRGRNAKDLIAIQDSLNNMLSTSPGERLFNPKYGCNLEHLLFELCDTHTASLILFELYRCLGSWDPRIKVNLQQTSVTPVPEEHLFQVYLVLDVFGVEDGSIFQFSLNQMG